MRSHDRGSEGVLASLEDQHALYRRVESNAKLLEFRCVEFAEELLYGPLQMAQA